MLARRGYTDVQVRTTSRCVDPAPPMAQRTSHSGAQRTAAASLELVLARAVSLDPQLAKAAGKGWGWGPAVLCGLEAEGAAACRAHGLWELCPGAPSCVQSSLLPPFLPSTR
eukprot:316395-Chlamydomonas_euryale.AAC.1